MDIRELAQLADRFSTLRLLDRTQWEICEYPRSRLLRPPPELLAGWHRFEQGRWRWTERRFAARFPEALARPAC
jgi:hypothetical protein